MTTLLGYILGTRDEIYRQGLFSNMVLSRRSYMTTDRGPLLSFDDAVKEDISANNALENFSKTIVEKVPFLDNTLLLLRSRPWQVESIKASPRRTIDVTFWGAIPVQGTSESLKYNSNRVADISKRNNSSHFNPHPT